MKTFIWVVLCALSLLVSPELMAKEFLSGSGKVIAEAREVSAFEKLTVDGSAQVFLKKDNETSVRVEAEDNVMQYVVTEVNSGRLHIFLDLRGDYSGLRTHKGIRVYVTTPEISSVAINGSGSVQGAGQWECQLMQISLNGSGSVKMSLSADRLVTSLQGSARVFLDGQVKEQNIKISGSAGYQAASLTSLVATVTISGSGDAVVNAKEDLDVQIFGSGNVSYSGSPRLHQQILGSGRVVGR